MKSRRREPAPSPLIVRRRGAGAGRIGSDYQPKPEAAEPLYSHLRVSSSVHPGTAKPLGTTTPGAGRKWPAGGLERCTVAALAEAHKVINRPKAKTDRIVFAPFSLSIRAIMCARAATAPSCSGFTIGQICGIMGACPPSPAADRPMPPRNAGTSITVTCTPGRLRIRRMKPGTKKPRTMPGLLSC
jgi:hypothetical protein